MEEKSQLVIATGILVIIAVAAVLGVMYAYDATGSSSPSVDASAGGQCNAATSCSASISTSKASELVLAFYSTKYSGAAPTNFACSDAAGVLSFTQRASSTDGSAHIAKLFYAAASQTLSSDSITCSYSGAANESIITIVTVSNYDKATPFDPNTNLPATGGGATATSGSMSISTSNANDLLLGFFKVDGTSQTYSAGSGFTSVISEQGGLTEFIESESVSSTQSAVSVSAGWSLAHDWLGIADAIQGSSGALTTSSTSSTTSSSQSANTTISSSSSSSSTTTTQPITQNPILLTQYFLGAVIVILIVAIAVMAIRRRS